MSKPDFSDYAHELWPQVIASPSIEVGADLIADALRTAYAAGLERAAEIADKRAAMMFSETSREWDDGHQNAAMQIAAAIRAEKGGE